MVKVRELGFFPTNRGNIIELTTTKASLIELDSGGTPTNVIEIPFDDSIGDHDLTALFGSNRVTVISLKNERTFILIYLNTLHLLDFDAEGDHRITSQADFFHRPDFDGEIERLGRKEDSTITFPR